MIYAKPIIEISIIEISWNVIESIRHPKIPKAAYLDYKEDYPSRLEKTISIMANTYGKLSYPINDAARTI